MGIEELSDIPARLASAVEQLEREFASIYGRSHIETLVHESAEQLKSAAVASFVPLLAHRVAREPLRAQAQSEGTLSKSSTEIVFVSITGGGRARMAASRLRRRLGEAISIHTAGSGAAAAIDPNVETAMHEIGIDLTDKYARPLTPRYSPRPMSSSRWTRLRPRSLPGSACAFDERLAPGFRGRGTLRR